MNNRVVLINLSVEGGYAGVNHGLAFLAPYAKKHAFDVAGLNIYNDIHEDEFIDRIKAMDPAIVAYSCTSSPQIRSLSKYSHALKKCSNVLQITGGVGPTLEPGRFMSESAVDGVCIGEGEIPMDALLSNMKQKLNPFSTPGFHWRVNGKIEIKPVCPYVPDLSLLESPDYTIFNEEQVCMRRPITDLVVDGPSISVILSRGCPNNCTYCCAPVLKKIYKDQSHYIRVPSVDYSIRLIQKLLTAYPRAKAVWFHDDLLVSNKKWLSAFSVEYERQIHIPCTLLVRSESIDPAVIEALKRMRCKLALIGLENGNEEFRKRYLNRKYSNRAFIEACVMLKKAGINIYTFNMVGFPFETGREMEDTYNLNREIEPAAGICSFFLPFRNTKLFDICLKEGLLPEQNDLDRMSNYLTRPAIKMTPEQQQECIGFHDKIMGYLKGQRNETMKSLSAV